MVSDAAAGLGPARAGRRERKGTHGNRPGRLEPVLSWVSVVSLQGSEFDRCYTQVTIHSLLKCCLRLSQLLRRF